VQLYCSEGDVVNLDLRHTGSLGSVGSVDLGVNGQVVVSQSEYPVMSVGKDGGQGLGTSSAGPVEHLGLELAELVLEVGEVVGKGLDDARVNGPKDSLVGGPEVLRSLEGGHIVGPELGLLGEGNILSVQIERHSALLGYLWVRKGK